MAVRSAVMIAVLAAAASAYWAIEFNGFPIDGSQTVPPSGSSAQGTGYGLMDNLNNEFNWYLSYSGLSSPVTGSHLHVGAPGTSGAIEVDLGTDNPAKGSLSVTPSQFDQILLGNWYFDVHTVAFPAGEIRGQVLDMGTVQWTNMHGGKSGTSRYIPFVGHGPMTGGSLNEVQLFTAPPNTSSYLVVGASALSVPLKGGILVPSPDLLIPVQVDATGKHTLSFVWPNDPAFVGFAVFWQHWYTDTGASLNLAASKGLQSIGQ